MTIDPVKQTGSRTVLQLLCAVLVLGILIAEAAAAEFTLERVVLVSRHGVRAPTNSDALKQFASEKWPRWPVKDACLTPRGKMLASRMGAYYRREFTARGLLPADPRLAADQVHVWADVDHRTKETGTGLLEGIFACGGPERKHEPSQDKCPALTYRDGCPSAQHGDGKNDPLFHPVRGGGTCAIDKARAREDILERALENVLKPSPYPDSLQKLQAVLGCCRPEYCKNEGAGDSCTLPQLPSSIEDADDGGLRLKGPISIGSTTSEVFLLEYAQGKPPKKVAWGRGSTPDKIVPLLQLHRLQFELMQRTIHLAKPQGSALVNQILETLRQTADGEFGGIRPVPREAKLVIYVGHDTNLANIGALLGVHWQLKSYLRDETPPAGAMAFELLRGTAASQYPGQYFVRMAYYSQTLDQMRDATLLSLKRPPDRAQIAPCLNSKDGACPWRDFYTQVSATLDPNPACVKPH